MPACSAYQNQQPFPETGGRVSSISSMAEWNALLKKATHGHHALAQARGATSVEEDERRVLRAGRDADLVLCHARFHHYSNVERTSSYQNASLGW